MKVACIVPTHGRPDYLEEALLSVLAQVGDLLAEIVVVDDIGDPESEAIVDRVKAHAPEAVKMQYVFRGSDSPGVSASRNAGAKKSSSGLLAFLDDDDYWHPTHLLRLASALVEADADMAISWMNVVTISGEIKSHYSISTGLKARNVLAQNAGVTGSNFLVTRDAFDLLGGFDEALPVSNDKDFLIRALDAEIAYAVSTARTAFQRRHTGEQLTDWDSRRAAGTRLMYEKHRSRLSRRDRRYMLSKIHSMERRESNGLARFWHAVRVVTLTPTRELLLKAVGRGRET